MTDQPPLWHDTISDALRTCVSALGGPKKAGSLLRPELPVDQAGRWLSDCLNDARRDHLSLEHLLMLLVEARRVGCHAGMAFICEHVGYADPQPVEPEDEAAALQREFLAGLAQQRRMLERLEQLQTRVKPATLRAA